LNTRSVIIANLAPVNPSVACRQHPVVQQISDMTMRYANR